MMDEPTIDEWMDRHHVEIVRTHATNLDGLAVGKYLNRPKFIKSLPGGSAISDMALAMDPAGSPHLTFWHEFRGGALGDILMRPDIETLVSDGTDPNLGHCVCDFTTADGGEISVCPRSLLRRITQAVKSAGFNIQASFELEFFVFHTSFADARRKDYKHLEPVGASRNSNLYLLRNAYHAKHLMDEVIKRINWQGIKWESWSDEGGVGQVELNFPPAAPVTAADTIIRVRQIIYEVAVDLEMSVTFMAHPFPGFSNGLHIHHSLLKDDEHAFYADGTRSQLMDQWIAGMIATMPGATSMLCPSINSFRRLTEFQSPPVVASWGEENKSAALRIISRSASLARIEHRLAAGDANPYLALAVILAGGLAGFLHTLTAPAEMTHIGWGLPAEVPRLPLNTVDAWEALRADKYLQEILGQDVIDYWYKSRRSEWLNFQTEASNPLAKGTTLWEYQRYFELV